MDIYIYTHTGHIMGVTQLDVHPNVGENHLKRPSVGSSQPRCWPTKLANSDRSVEAYPLGVRVSPEIDQNRPQIRRMAVQLTSPFVTTSPFDPDSYLYLPTFWFDPDSRCSNSVETLTMAGQYQVLHLADRCRSWSQKGQIQMGRKKWPKEHGTWGFFWMI